MGFFKPLSRLKGVTALQRVIMSLFEAGVEDVLVVTGHRGEDVGRLAASCGAETVHNPLFDRGMFTSVQAGVAAMPEDAGAFFLLPADIPAVRPATLISMANIASPDRVVHPAFRGRRGHPPLIGTSLIPLILNHTGEGGLRAVWESRAITNVELPVSDQGVLMDMDTRKDFELILVRLETNSTTPSRDERLALWEMAETPERVRRHCDRVASTCLAIGMALKRRGVEVDLPLLRGAALFHDVCRHREDHVRRGEEFLRTNGFPKMAAVAACHKDLPSRAPVEAAILHLSDKLVKDTGIVTLAERKKQMRAAYGTDADAWASIGRRYAAARRTARMVEKKTGCPLSDILDHLT